MYSEQLCRSIDRNMYRDSLAAVYIDDIYAELSDVSDFICPVEICYQVQPVAGRYIEPLQAQFEGAPQKIDRLTIYRSSQGGLHGVAQSLLLQLPGVYARYAITLTYFMPVPLCITISDIMWEIQLAATYETTTRCRTYLV